MIDIVETEMLMAIAYALRDYDLIDCTENQPYVEQLYAQMMGWA